MALIYATMPTLTARLKNRLQILGAATPAFGQTLGAQQIDPDFLIAIGESIEAGIDATLDLIYILPIVSHRAILILRSIAEKLIVDETTRTYFNITVNPQMGGDANFGASYRQEAINELERYTAGYGVYYKMGSVGVNRMGNQIQQCVPLPEVPLKLTQDVKRTLQPFDAIVVHKMVDDSTDPNYIKW
jgi:hypothetical protein